MGLTIASLAGINPYHFGQWNHYISLPWLKDLINPALYPGDVLIEQRQNSPTLYYYLLAAIAPLFQNNFSILFFVVYAFTLAATFFAIYYLALSVFKSQRSAWLALLLLSFTFPVLGDVRIWDSMLMERSLALPWLLISLALMLRRRYVPAVLLQALAFNFHALSTFHIILFSWSGMLLWQGWKWHYLKFAAIFLAFVSPVLYLKLAHSSGDSLINFSHIWMEVMQIRNAHHIFISHESGFVILKSLAVIMAYFYLLKRYFQQHSTYRFFWGFGIAGVAMLATGIVFTEVMPVRLIIQLQFLRSFVFFTIAFFILWAGIVRSTRSAGVGILGLVVAAQYFYGQWPKAAVAIAVMVTAWYFLTYTPRHIAGGIKWPFKAKLSFLLVPLSIYVIGAVGGYYKNSGLELNYWENNNAYANVGDWLKKNTSPGALLIAPPQEAGLRLLSERSCYGEWYDGTKAFFSESYARHWHQCMQKLRTPDPQSLKKDFRKNKEQDFRVLADSLHRHHAQLYVIQYADTPLDLPRLYKNEKFAVYHLSKNLAMKP